MDLYHQHGIIGTTLGVLRHCLVCRQVQKPLIQNIETLAHMYQDILVEVLLHMIFDVMCLTIHTVKGVM